MVGSACVFTGELKATELRFSFLSLLPFRCVGFSVLEDYYEFKYLFVSITTSFAEFKVLVLKKAFHVTFAPPPPPPPPFSLSSPWHQSFGPFPSA